MTENKVFWRLQEEFGTALESGDFIEAFWVTESFIFLWAQLC